MRGWVLYVICLVFLAVALCLPIDNLRLADAAPAMGAFTVRVTRGPLTPVNVPGMPSPPNQVVGAQIDIKQPDGTVMQSVKTDSDGVYRGPLPPGTYKVTMPSLYGAMFTQDLPATITIISGQETRLDIRLDTGIR